MQEVKTDDNKRVVCRAKFFFQGEEKFYVKGVTYGPFRPKPETPEVFLPDPAVAARDFSLMREMGANLVRVYHQPPTWFYDLLQEHGLKALVTVPWEQHINFLDSAKTRQGIRRRILGAVEQAKGHPALFAILVGNEIPPDIARWYGLKRVRDFLDSLILSAKETDPDALVSYACYPSTEYLLPRFVDFYTYNVYLERRTDFRNYLARLQNLAEEKPLILGEFGLDTIRNPEEKQSEIFTWHIETQVRGGLAGTVLFSWTDEWFTGGHDITDWAFGVVKADRTPKHAYGTVQKLWTRPDSLVPLPEYPKVSIVVCSYNGGKTLRGALDSLDKLNYPDYEVILVDDGSTDDSQQIVADFEKTRAGKPNLPVFRNLVQTNLGLSAARNNGIYSAHGDIVAFTDSDCVADRDWLYYLISALIESKCAAVGGPNISPPAHNWIQACVAAAPGSPSHVLLSDTIAEHVPGCNMAYWRWALLEIEGFDIEYRKAGDDVDVCWRLMQRGYEIAFSPSAVVWHHRRFTIQAYFGQQRGYGEAESLLRFKHLVYFGPTGGAKWRGTVYGMPRFEHFLSGPIIYHGAFGMGLFQCIYPRQESEWAGLASSLEWVILTLFIFLISLEVESLRLVPLIMWGLTLSVGVSWMARAKIEPKHDSVIARLLLLYLSVTQPLARGWARYMTWFRNKRTPTKVIASGEPRAKGKVKWHRMNQQAFWNEDGKGRHQLLTKISELLENEEWKYSLDAGWGDWDVQVFGNRWWQLELKTANEYHGGPKVLVRVEYRPTISLFSIISLTMVLILVGAGVFAFGSTTYTFLGVAGLSSLLLLIRGWRLRHRVALLVEAAAESCGFISLNSKQKTGVKTA